MSCCQKAFCFYFFVSWTPQVAWQSVKGSVCWSNCPYKCCKYFCDFSEESGGKYWFEIAGGKTLSCLKSLNASQTDLGAGALPDPILKQLGFSPNFMKLCFSSNITQA